jgi:hypothetical protein
LLERCTGPLFVIVVILLGGGQGKSLVELCPSLLLFAESEISTPKFQMMGNAPRLKSNRFAEILNGLFVRGIGKLSVNRLGKSF